MAIEDRPPGISNAFRAIITLVILAILFLLFFNLLSKRSEEPVVPDTATTKETPINPINGKLNNNGLNRDRSGDAESRTGNGTAPRR